MASDMVLHSSEELCTRSVHDLDPRVVDEVPSHPRQVLSDVDRDPCEVIGRPDAAPKQDGGRAVGARRHNDEVRRDLGLAAVDADDRPDRALALEAKPVDECIGHDREVRPLSSRIEIGERRVPANVADRIDQDRRRALEGSGIVEVLEHRKADLDRRVESGAHERLEVVHARGADAEHLLAASSVGLQSVVGPSGIPGLGPLVEVRRRSPRNEAAVVCGTSTDDLGTPGRPPAR
jgi:hypothetical protein